MSDLLMTTWDGAGVTPPMMSVARALVERGHDACACWPTTAPG